MKPIKYSIMLLAVLTALGGVLESKVIYRRTSGSKSSLRRRREQERREQERKKKARAQLIKKQKEHAKKMAELRKKRIAENEAREHERKEKAEAVRKEKEKQAAAAAQAARQEKLMLGQYDTMATEVKLSSIQRKKLVAMVRKAKGLPPKTADHNPEIARLTALHAKATGNVKKILAARLAAAKKRVADQQKKQDQKSEKASGVSKGDLHRNVMGLLTPAQKRKWGGYQLSKDPALRFPGMEFTKKQLDRMRVLCDEAARELPDEAVATDPAVVARKKKSILTRLRIRIIYEVFTPQQRAAALK